MSMPPGISVPRITESPYYSWFTSYRNWSEQGGGQIPVWRTRLRTSHIVRLLRYTDAIMDWRLLRRICVGWFIWGLGQSIVLDHWATWYGPQFARGRFIDRYEESCQMQLIHQSLREIVILVLRAVRNAVFSPRESRNIWQQQSQIPHLLTARPSIYPIISCTNLKQLCAPFPMVQPSDLTVSIARF